MDQIYDDGSTLTFDAAGTIVSGRDSSGAAILVPPPEGSSIVQQFSNLLTYGVRSVLDSKLRGGAAPAAAGAPIGAGLSAQVARLLPLGLLIAGLALAYKAFAK